MRPALLVVVEGSDGSGKTRQTDAVVDALCARGFVASAFHHKRTGASGDAYCAALDYAHQRAGACFGTDYAPGTILIFDRWFVSGAVELQCHFDERMQRVLEVELDALPDPNLWVFLDAPDAVLDARLAERGERSCDVDAARRSHYREAAPMPDVHRVDTSGDFAATTETIVSLVQQAQKGGA